MFIGGVVTIDTKYSELIKLAKHYNIEYYGVHKKELVTILNLETQKRIDDEMNKEESIEKTKYDFISGSIVNIINGLLINRKMKVVEHSERKNALKGHLINKKNGKLQKTLVTIPLEYIEK